MKQLNCYINTVDEESIAHLQKHLGLKSRAEAVRQALRIAAQVTRNKRPGDYSHFLGRYAARPENPKPKFATEDDLWS